jgi:RHS repeat-associated protein
VTLITTDHLGTPMLTTSAASMALWSGGFEPFAADWGSAESSGVFLRFPGQWSDPAWSVSEGLVHNVNRWAQPGTGRYERQDPVGLRAGGLGSLNHLYSYALQSPLVHSDPRGLLATRHCSPDQVRALEAAVATAQQALGDRGNPCELCWIQRVFLGLHLAVATYSCVEDDETIRRMYRMPATACANTRNSQGAQDGSSISLNPQAFNQQEPSPEGCGCLAGTVLHEATHNVLGASDIELDPNNAYNLERRCLPCS